MGLFDNLKGDDSLFLNEVVLDFEYTPKMVKYRESENEHIASCIKPLFQRRDGKNLFIFSVPGTGKTLAIKNVFNELVEKGLEQEAVPIYINCWKKDTAHKIAMEICEQLGYRFTHNKTTDELLKEISKMVNKKALVIALDECDKAKELDILYWLLEDIYRKTIFLVTNEKDWLTKLDQRVRSRLIPEHLEFRHYNLNEIEGILRQRVDLAFVRGVFDENAFKKIVDLTSKINDLRSGLFLLKESGNNAEARSSKKITDKDVDLAIRKLDDFKIKDSANLLDEDRDILNLVKENSGKTLRNLYEIYKMMAGGKSFSTFHRKIHELKNNGFIKTEEVNEGYSKALIVRYK